MSIRNSFLIMFFLLVLTSAAKADSETFAWSVQGGGNGFDMGAAVAADAAGNVFITGYFQETATFGTEDVTAVAFRDFYVSKYDNNGNVIWARGFGGTSEDESYGIATDSEGNCFVTGAFGSTVTFGDTSLSSYGSDDIFIIKMDPDGNVLWAEQAGGTNLDQGNAVTTDSDGNCIVTGYYSLTATFGDTTVNNAGNYDIFIAKYDMNGTLLWVETAGGQYFDQGNGIATDGFGNVSVTGKFSSQVAFGDTSIMSTRTFNSFIASYSPSGNLRWVEKAGGSPADFGSGITTDPMGNVLVTGYFQGTGTFGDSLITSTGSGDIYLAKYAPSGDLKWARKAGGQDLDQGYCVATDHEGNSWVSGYFVGTATFGDTTLTSEAKDIFIAKYDSKGTVIWAGLAGGPGTDEGRGIAVDAHGNGFITGLFEGSATFDDTTLNSINYQDVFITKIGQDGVSSIGEPLLTATGFQLSQNYPNPFNPTTTIRYVVGNSAVETTYRASQQQRVQLTIHNLLGQKIATLVDAVQTSGRYSVSWDGTNDEGQSLASGIYFYRLTVGGSSGERSGNSMLIRKMMLVR